MSGTDAGNALEIARRQAAEMSAGWTAAAVIGAVVLAVAFVTKPGLFVDNAIGGLVYGMILVMVALGLSLILGLMGVVNFAHGALFMLGAYFAWQTVAAMGLSFWTALVVAPVAVGLVGVLMEVAVLRHIYDEEPIIGLLATFGLTMMIEEIVRGVWGAAPKSFELPPVLATNTDLGVTQVGTFRLFMVALSGLSILLVYLLITRTDFGLTVRAGVQDSEMTEFLGVDLPLRFTAMFFLGATIAGVGGVLRGAEVGMGPGMGEKFVILAFVVVVVGGAGSLFGSVAAGLIIGEAQYLLTVVLVAWADVTGIEAINVGGLEGLVPYLVMLVVLLVRPRGLFGEEGFLE